MSTDRLFVSGRARAPQRGWAHAFKKRLLQTADKSPALAWPLSFGPFSAKTLQEFMLFGRKISKLWGLLRWVLTVGFQSAHRSQLQLLLCRRRLQDFSQTSSVCFACRRWCFPHHADRLEKNSFFNDLSFLGSALAWFGLCSEELRGCGFAVRAARVVSSTKRISFRCCLRAQGRRRCTCGTRLLAAARGSALCWDFPGRRTQSRTLTESRTFKEEEDLKGFCC